MVKDLTSFIVSQLRLLGFELFGANDRRPNMTTFCFKGHDKDTPSLSIHKASGRFLCFGCGVKGGSWNALAAHINGKMLSDEELPSPFPQLAKDMAKKMEEAFWQASLPWDLRNWDRNYRRVALETWNALGAYKWYDDPMRCNRVLLPIHMYGELEGWVARRVDKPIKNKPYKMKYRNAPAMRSQDMLYPLDAVIKMRTSKVALVEGPFDAVRLINFDIPALAILGTNNYRDDNRVHLLNAGIDKVYLALDSDKSGQKARRVLGPSLAEMFSVEDFYCPVGKDPGNMPMSHMMRLWRKTR